MASSPECPQPRHDGESGVSLVEIVVAMFLFAVMSAAVLPLMMGAVKASAANRDLVAVHSLANEQLAKVETAFPSSVEHSCALVVSTAVSGVPDRSGSGAIASITFGTCPSPSSYPATVTVTVQAFRPGSTTPAITLDSAILVASP